ncbi:hypothetical protein [Legionella spiritensis]|uniref:hypothetical protein n=1 Tax=Legionella spiritensis TaxID=452 RepID=UPI000F7085C3|nr:hypothetical protein [Legionella spiritensis]VEG89979.1 Uncharacterised protein [Legionella spiritensis]
MTSSNWSGRIVRLAESKFYMRLIILIYTFALSVVLTSGLPIAIKITLLLFLLFSVIHVYHTPHYTSGMRTLIYKKTGWQLINEQDVADNFNHYRIIIDAGLFLLVEFSTARKRRVFIIFSDQISSDEHRFLKIIEKIK